MADRYWVGGTGTWNGTNTANWSTSDGGASGASVPTSADNVFFTALSNTGTSAFTVTLATVAANCLSWDSTGVDGTLTVAGSVALNVYGSMSLKATQHTWNKSGNINFLGTTTGLTCNTNGISFASENILFNGVGGYYTLTSAIAGFRIYLRNGTLNTNGFAVTVSNLVIGDVFTTRSLICGSSTITISSTYDATATTGLTFDAGTSTFASAGGLTFISGGLTYYNISVTRTTVGSSITFSGPLNCTNFSAVAITTTTASDCRRIELGFGTTMTCTGSFTINGGPDRNTRTMFSGPKSLGTWNYGRITVSAASYSVADVNFHGIDFVGAGAPVTGTSISDHGANTGVTFTSPKTVYKVGGAVSWLETCWATSSGGSAAKDNAPLGQDTIIIDDNSGASLTTASSTAECTAFCKLDSSARTTSFNWISASAIYIGGNNGGLTLHSSFTSSSSTRFMLVMCTGTFDLNAAASFPFYHHVYIWHINGGSTRLLSDFVNTNTATEVLLALLAGELNLNGYMFKWNGAFTVGGSVATARSLTYGSGGNLVANSRTGSTNAIFNMSQGAAFTVTADPTSGKRPFTYSGTAAIALSAFNGTLAGITESNALDLIVTATGITSSSYASSVFRHVDFSAAGATSVTFSGTVYGDFTMGTGVTTYTASTSVVITFASTSATERVITTNGKTLNRPITFNGVGGSWRFADDATIGTAAETLTLTRGSVNLNGKVVTVPKFSTLNSNVRTLDFSVAGSRMDLSANGTTVIEFTATNLTVLGTSDFNLTYTGSSLTRTLAGTTAGTGSSTNKINVRIAAGTDNFAITGQFESVDFSGGTFAGTLNAGTRTLGTLKLSSGTTASSGTAVTTMSQFSGDTGYLSTNGVTFNCPITVNTLGTTELGSALSMLSSRSLTVTSGTFKTMNYAVTTGSVQSSNSNTRHIDIGSSTVTLTTTSNAFYFLTATGLTFASTTGMFSFAAATASSGTLPNTAVTFPAINLGGAGTVTISQSGCTVKDFRNSVTPAGLIFSNGLAINVENFSLLGTAGNLVSVSTTTAGNTHTLTKTTSGNVSCDYLNISRSIVTGSGAGAGVTWYAGANSTNGGTNTGWVFTAPPSTTFDGSFFQLFNWA